MDTSVDKNAASESAADRTWDHWIEELDLHGTNDPGAMLEAARQLERLAGSPGSLDAAAAPTPAPTLASGPASGIAPPGSAIPVARPARLRAFAGRWGTVAAIALVTVALTAAATLVWSGKRSISGGTLSYSQALEFLRGEEYPSADRKSAMLVVLQRVLVGVDALQKVQQDPSAPTPLREAARTHLQKLAALLDAGSFEIDAHDEQMELWRGQILDPQLDAAQRGLLIDAVAAATARGIQGLRDMNTQDAVVASSRASYLRTLKGRFR